MAQRRKRTVKRRPKMPARVKKRRRKGARPRSHHHPELIGLALVGSGVFLACVLWLGLNGGPVSSGVTDGIGWVAYLAPVVLIPLGALIVTRSQLVSVRPFRMGLCIALVGLLLTLGAAHGGLAGDGLGSVFSLGLGDVGATILGVLLTTAGVLLPHRRLARRVRAPLRPRRPPRLDPRPA